MDAQSTFEGCLAVCLLKLTNQKVTKKKELEIILHALKFSKWNFTEGHLDFFKKQKLKQIVEKKNKLSLSIIDELLKKSEVIVYTDAFAYWKIKHYPHFVLVKNKSGSSYKVFDPWDGKIKIMPRKTLSASSLSLRRLGFSPQVIYRKKS